MTNWTVRRACGSVLDALSEAYGEEILPFVLPELQSRLSATGADDASWRLREAGLLALAAVYRGNMDAMAQYAPQLWPIVCARCR